MLVPVGWSLRHGGMGSPFGLVADSAVQVLRRWCFSHLNLLTDIVCEQCLCELCCGEVCMYHALYRAVSMKFEFEFEFELPFANCGFPSVSFSCSDWVKSRHLGLLDSYECRVRDSLVHSPVSDVSCVDQVNEEVARFTDMLLGAAREELPLVRQGGRPQYRDERLKALCRQSMEARKKWRENGCPTSGPLFDEKRRLRIEVRKRVKHCAVQSERRQRQKLFSSRAPH